MKTLVKHPKAEIAFDNDKYFLRLPNSPGEEPTNFKFFELCYVVQMFLKHIGYLNEEGEVSKEDIHSLIEDIQKLGSVDLTDDYYEMMANPDNERLDQHT